MPPLDAGEIAADVFAEIKMVPSTIEKVKAYLAIPKADRKYAGLCDILGIVPDGLLGQQLAMIDTVEEQAAS